MPACRSTGPAATCAAPRSSASSATRVPSPWAAAPPPSCSTKSPSCSETPPGNPMNTLDLIDPPCITEELRMLREQVRRFVNEEVIPVADAWEREGYVPRTIFRRLGELGLLGMRHPASVLVHTDMSSTHISRRCTDEQKSKYLPGIISGEKIVAIAVTEPGAGSDVAGMKTRAERDGDHWVINGSKLYITNGVHGDIYIVAARTDPQAKGSRGISLFIVEKGTPGLTARYGTCRPRARSSRCWPPR